MTPEWADQPSGPSHRYHRHFAGRCAGGHVSCVLLVARRIGDDKFAARSLKVAVSNVDGDALFALGLQPVGEQRKIEWPGRAVDGTLADRLDLIVEGSVGIVQEASDQRGLAVIYAAGRFQ